MSEARSLDEVEEAAATWDVRLRRSGAGPTVRAEFEAWLRTPEHRAAYDRLQATLSQLRAQAASPELSVLRQEARSRVARIRRRRWTIGVSAVAASLVLVVAVIGIATGRGTDIWNGLQGARVYQTALNERTRVVLADGSVMTLDSGTKVSVHFQKARRDVQLFTGRALFKVAHAPQRPFVVAAGDRTVTAVGTEFDVGLAEKMIRVTLVEGRVAVRSAGSGATPIQYLQPRQQLVEEIGSAAVQPSTVDVDKALGWLHGQVFFDNDSLGDAVIEMNRYSRRKVVVDPAVANLRISGMFRTDDQTGFVGAIETILPVEGHDEDGGVTLKRRPAG